MAPWSLIIRAVMALEDVFVQRLLASPSFHHVVRRIHRGVQEARYGRDPNEPLRKGEATADPSTNGSGGRRGFLSHFIEELGLQARGRATQIPKDLPAKKKK
ncbi:uncharacterized protein SPSK_04660 [Sporothrix schenckii 1099-18]|uniref:Uncharacterized protein n=1 Tax=Sporothrix schenckii 1099-18 TaxID=1397361 RepID=A0A0F2M1L9_SPOSC|nr:uncharacterized protein SPSK_04660 [Sporothrix schenckii 1099-18]KJR83593.1 hypothetical protein SPSK_04660 [Sporothrix schenckii 1099-18]